MIPPDNRNTNGRQPPHRPQPSPRPQPQNPPADSSQTSVHPQAQRPTAARPQPQRSTAARPQPQRPQPSPQQRPTQRQAMASDGYAKPQRPAASPYKQPRKPDRMQQSYKMYKKRQRTRRKMIRFSLLAGVPILLVIILIVCLHSCSKKEQAEPVQASGSTSATENSVPETTSSTSSETAQHSDKEKSSQESSQQDSSEESSKEESSQSEEEMLTYDNPHQYSINYNRFSPDTMSELEQNITSGYVALYDVTRDEIIFSHNYSKKCFPASTTKLLTAITACRIITDPNKVITVGDEITMIDPESSIAYLQEGMQLTFEMLIDALLLPSGNDAAYTIAVNCGRIYKNNPKLSNEKAVKAFMEQVNVAAEQIGAEHTHYVTPDGIHDDDHYTSAEDLVKIGDYAKTIPLINKSCSKAYVEWDLVKGGSIAWSNSNKLVQWDSGFYSEYCDGLKTGFTDQAGTSVVASATMKGHTLIAVVMDGQTLYTKYEDCNLLFKKGFELYDLNYTYG